MNEVIRNADLLIMQGVLAEESLRLEIALLQKYKRKISTLLEEKELNEGQRAALHNLLSVIDSRNLKLYAGD